MTVKVVDVVAAALRAEGVEYLSAYPTTPVIDAAARVGIRPVICRQERVGVGIADGYSRVGAPDRYGVFACQFGPGLENSFSGIASAYSDRIPILVLALGNALDRLQLRPQFRAAESFRSISTHFETLLRAEDVHEVMRRAFNALKNGPSGPVIVELPADVAVMAVGGDPAVHVPVEPARSCANPRTVDDVIDRLDTARSPIIVAGHGVLLGGATTELVDLAELYQIPVVTTLGGKSGFPERHPLSAGVASVVATDVVVSAIASADLALVIGSSLSRHFLSVDIPPAAELIHLTDDARDFHKTRRADFTLLGDARLVLAQLLACARVRPPHKRDRGVSEKLRIAKAASRTSWRHVLESEEQPITPYRVIHEFMAALDADDVIVTHDSGSPRDQMTPFYVSGGPSSYLGWGKSHALGAGIGLTIGAKLAAPDKIAVHFHGDAAFGMTGLDIETAQRIGAPILSIVLNNSTMAIETRTLLDSHEAYRTRDIGGSYAMLATALGVESRRVTDPGELGEAFLWAADTNRSGRSALVEVITSAETRFVNRHVVNGRMNSQ